MQLLLIRHAKPKPIASGDSGDPYLSYDGNEQTRRLPDALSKFTLTRIVSSPEARALQTAAPVADPLGMTVDIDDRLAEEVNGLDRYLPGDDAAHGGPDGDRTDGFDADGFVARVRTAIDDLAANSDPGDTVAVFTHGSVISALVHSVMKTDRLFCVDLDYTGVTRLKVSVDGGLRVASVNVTDHVWDILYRTQWWSEEH
ncbi:histidine phosphatase family protein [Mycobacterium sp. MBM]|nr:histidine phosphatase family protein [Mycobacterium sp. MBM]